VSHSTKEKTKILSFLDSGVSAVKRKLRKLSKFFLGLTANKFVHRFIELSDATRLLLFGSVRFVLSETFRRKCFSPRSREAENFTGCVRFSRLPINFVCGQGKFFDLDHPPTHTHTYIHTLSHQFSYVTVCHKVEKTLTIHHPPPLHLCHTGTF
jgi:hypothetical protein